MRRTLKITGIILGALVGILIVAAAIAVAMVTSPERLTKILKQYAPQYIHCQTELGRASLTLVKAFPNVCLNIEHVALVNPMEGSPSDTLASIEGLAMSLDVKELLKEKRILVRECVLENVLFNIYTDPEGNSNLNVFNVPESQDTTSPAFDYLVDVEGIKLKKADFFFTDSPGHFLLTAKGLDLDLKGQLQDNDVLASLEMKVEDFYILDHAAPFALTNVNIGFEGGMKQWDRIEGVLTAHKPDLRLKPSRSDPVNVIFPFEFSLKDLTGHYEKVQASLDNKYRIYLAGGAKITERGHIVFDFGLKSDKMDFQGLLSYLPEEVQKVLNTNGPQDWLQLTARHAQVAVNPTRTPFIQLGFQADDLAAKVSGRPDPLVNLSFGVLMSEDISKVNAVESLEINRLKAQIHHSTLEVQGILDDIPHDVLLKLKVNGDVLLSDVKPLLPQTIRLDGRTRLDLTTDFTAGDLNNSLADYKLDRLSAKADLEIKDLVFDMDTIHAATPQFKASVALPELALIVDSQSMDAQLGDSYALNTYSLGMKASVRQDMGKKGFLNQWDPRAEFTLGNAEVKIHPLEETIHADNLDFHFNPDLIDVRNCTFRLGQSDLSVRGGVTGFKEQMENHTGVVKGDFHLNTDLLEVKEIVGLINGLGAEPKETKDVEPGPFMVPTGIDLAVDVHTKKAVYEDLDFNDLTGTITMKDSALYLQDLHFYNKAAQMQLSALYESAQKDNLFLAMDFSLGDVLIGDLLHMIPYIDTLVPMLKTFDGQCDINIDVATNLGPNYLPKLPILRGEADIKGRNLTVNDEFTFTKITDLLGVSTHGEYRVDSLDVQLSALDSKIDLLPSQIAIGKYGAVAEGFMTPDKNLEYHISLTESPFPMRHALKISGSLDKLKFDLEPSKYPNHYTPLKHSERRQFHKDLRKMLKERLKNRLKKTEND